MKPRKLTITATQRLGKRLDGLEREFRGVTTRLDATDERLKELSRELVAVASVGSYEMMYRIEREETVKLRIELAQVQHDASQGFAELLTALESGLSEISIKLRMEPEVYVHCTPDHTMTGCLQVGHCVCNLTSHEERILGKFRSELKKGLE